jgi:hypothetical protein
MVIKMPFTIGQYENYRNVHFKSWHRGRALALQIHHLWHKDLNVEGLQWYYGLGGQLKSMSAYYRYKYEDQFGNKYDNVYSTANYINVGVDGILGLEYTFKEVPISLFTEINLYMEVFRDPFFVHGQGGLAFVIIMLAGGVFFGVNRSKWLSLFGIENKKRNAN